MQPISSANSAPIDIELAYLVVGVLLEEEGDIGSREGRSGPMEGRHLPLAAPRLLPSSGILPAFDLPVPGRLAGI